MRTPTPPPCWRPRPAARRSSWSRSRSCSPPLETGEAADLAPPGAAVVSRPRQVYPTRARRVASPRGRHGQVDLGRFGPRPRSALGGLLAGTGCDPLRAALRRAGENCRRAPGSTGVIVSRCGGESATAVPSAAAPARHRGGRGAAGVRPGRPAYVWSTTGAGCRPGGPRCCHQGF